MIYLEILKQYWYLFLIFFLIGVIFACIVLAIAKKKPVLNYLDTVLKKAYELIPLLCAAIENPGNGSAKKNYVLKELQIQLFKLFGFKDFESIESLLTNQIEATLEAPHANIYNKEV